MSPFLFVWSLKVSRLNYFMKLSPCTTFSPFFSLKMKPSVDFNAEGHLANMEKMWQHRPTYYTSSFNKLMVCFNSPDPCCRQNCRRTFSQINSRTVVILRHPLSMKLVLMLLENAVAFSRQRKFQIYHSYVAITQIVTKETTNSNPSMQIEWYYPAVELAIRSNIAV